MVKEGPHKYINTNGYVYLVYVLIGQFFQDGFLHAQRCTGRFIKLLIGRRLNKVICGGCLIVLSKHLHTHTHSHNDITML